MVLVKSFEDTKKNLTNITSVLNTAKILLSQHITGVWRRRDRPGYFAKRNTERATWRPCPPGLSRSDWGIKLERSVGVRRRRDRPGYFAKRNTERATGRPCPRGLSRSDWGIKKMAGPHGQTISTLYINTQTNYPQYIGLYYTAY